MIRGLLLCGALIVAAGPAMAVEKITLVSASHRDPPRANGRATCNPQASDDGRYIVHCSFASNLVDGHLDGNGGSDVFLFDRDTGRNTLVSHAAWSPAVSAAGGTMSEENSLAAISGDGSTVFFVHDGLDLTAEGANGAMQLYRFDTATGVVTLVTRGTGGGPSNHDVLHAIDDVAGRSLRPSFNGRRLVFVSRASDLVAGQVDAFDSHDVFVHDADAGALRLLSHVEGQPLQASGLTGRQVDITPDGRFAAYDSQGVWRHDLDSLARRGVSGGAAGSRPRISSDGATVAYLSNATNIVAGQVDTNAAADLFAWREAGDASVLVSHAHGQPLRALDRGVGTTYWMRADAQRFVVSSAATDHGPVPDPDGFAADVLRYEAWPADATVVSSSVPTPASHAALGKVSPSGRKVHFLISPFGHYLYDEADGVTRPAGAGFAGQAPLSDPLLCAPEFFAQEVLHATCDLAFDSGREYQSLWPGANGVARIAAPPGPGTSRRHAVGGSTARLYDPPSRTLSADGRRVLFFNRNEGWHVSDRIQRTPLPPRIGAGQTLGVAREHTLSADGRRVAFVARGDELRAGAGDNAWLFDVDARALRAITALADCACDIDDLSGDGRRVLVSSSRPELTGDATQGTVTRLFLYDDATQSLALVSRRASGAPASGHNGRISRDGRIVVFTSTDTGIVGNSPAAGAQIYRLDTLTGSVTRVSHAPAQPGLPLAGGAELAGIDAAGLRALFETPGQPLAGITDTNGGGDLYLHDATDGSVMLVSHRHDATDTTLPQPSPWPSARLSGDGRRIAVKSNYSAAVAGYAPVQPQPFLYDVATRQWQAVARNDDGSSPNAEVAIEGIDHAGDFLLLSTRAGNVFGGMAPPLPDTHYGFWRWRRGAGATLLTHSPADAGVLVPGLPSDGQLDDSGRVAVLETDARGLSAEDGNGDDDVYRVELLPIDALFEDGFEVP